MAPTALVLAISIRASALRYVTAARSPGMCIAMSSASTCADPRSASEYTPTDVKPMLRNVLAMRQAIAPRFAISTRENVGGVCIAMTDGVVLLMALIHRLFAPDIDLYRCGVVAVAWVVQLRAVGYQHDHVHFRTQRDPLAGF